MRRIGNIFGAVVGAALLAGCSKTPPGLVVAEQWSDTISRFSLIPIYPMREDVFVGDLRVTVDRRTASTESLPYRSLGHLDLRKELIASYGARMELPATTRPEAAAGTFDGIDRIPWAQPVDDRGILRDRSGEPAVRPRLAALPAVNIARVRASDLGASGLLAGIPFALGLAGGDDVEMTITLSGIETMELPNEYLAVKKFKEWCSANSGNEAIRFLAKQLVGSPGGSAVDHRPQVSIITKVFYARGIDYRYKYDQAAAANLLAAQVKAAELSTRARLGLPAASAEDGGAKTDAEDGGAQADAKAEDLRARAAELRSSLAGNSAPGIAASFFYATERGIGLKQVFERPLAFAASAVAIDAGPLLAAGDADICKKPVSAPPGTATIQSLQQGGPFSAVPGMNEFRRWSDPADPSNPAAGRP